MGLSHSPTIVTDGLVLCLDAANSRSYPATGTTWTDLAGANNGTLTNMDASNFGEANGGSLSFDGTDEYVDLGSQVANLSTLTISFWINYNTFSSSHHSPIGYDANAYDYVVLFLSGLMYFRAGNNYTGISHNTINAGVWYNFVVTKGSSYIRCYQNNDLLGQSGTYSSTINVEWIGRGYVYDDAKISFVQVYDRALTADEIRQNYNATKGRYK